MKDDPKDELTKWMVETLTWAYASAGRSNFQVITPLIANSLADLWGSVRGNRSAETKIGSDGMRLLIQATLRRSLEISDP